MIHLCRTALLTMMAVVYGGAASAEPRTYALPDETATFRPGPGIEAAQNNCSACHSADYINTQPPKMGYTFWEGEVNKMKHAYGAPIEDSDVKAIVDYLAATY